jgi:hypothetical protein
MLLSPFGNLSHTSILYYYYDLYVILFQNYSNRGIKDSEVHLVVCFCLPLETYHILLSSITVHYATSSHLNGGVT